MGECKVLAPVRALHHLIIVYWAIHMPYIKPNTVGVLIILAVVIDQDSLKPYTIEAGAPGTLNCGGCTCCCSCSDIVCLADSRGISVVNIPMEVYIANKAAY